MNAVSLLARCRRAGVELFADGDRLRYRAPAGGFPQDLRARVMEHRADVLAILSPRPCPRCGRGLDARGACWARGCGYRRCANCGRESGSVFISLCLLCEHAEAQQGT